MQFEGVRTHRQTPEFDGVRKHPPGRFEPDTDRVRERRMDVRPLGGQSHIERVLIARGREL
jgi:hypothetical protein